MRIPSIILAAALLLVYSGTDAMAAGGKGKGLNRACQQGSQSTCLQQKKQAMKNAANKAAAKRRARRGNAMTVSTLSEAEIATLKFMYEEEKLAGDVYSVAYQTWSARVFSNIRASEVQHKNTMLLQLQRHGVDVSDLLSHPAGVYEDASLQALYDTLVAQVTVSLRDALLTGIAIENEDISDLDEAIAATTAPELIRAYGNLRSASVRHLRAFTAWLANV